MEFKFDETEMMAHKDNAFKDVNSYIILSKNAAVRDAELDNVIQIIDESGMEVNCTYDKFVEIFDEEGLSGFIL